MAAVYMGRVGVASSLSLSSEPWFWGCGQTNLSCKMVKGKLVEAGKWPWQVSILFMGMYICSGSIIHHQWVLTAAHCLERSVGAAGPGGPVRLGFWESQGYGWRPASYPRPCRSLDASKYSVIVGAQHLPANGTQLPLVRLATHENFKDLISDDIALLKLKDPILWSPLVQPICLPTTKLMPPIGASCWAMVWGRPSVKGEWRQFPKHVSFRTRHHGPSLPPTPSLLPVSTCQQTFPERLHVLHSPDLC